MSHKGHLSLSKYNWYFKWTGNIKSYEVSVPRSLYFGRYKDDCLVLWDGTDEKLQKLYNLIKTRNQDLKSTVEIGNQSIFFVDLKISIVGNKLTTNVYSKPVGSHLYIHADSCHKKISIKGIQRCCSYIMSYL